MRKMASIQIIDSISPIEGADKIEVAQVRGWKVVVKKGEFEPDDAIVFCEIDSWIPHNLAPFLTPKGEDPKEFEGVKGERLRTVRLRGQISQGLILPLCPTMENRGYSARDVFQLRVGDDLSEILGIVKWERPIPTNLAGQVKGNFPSFIPKTDQERIQNISDEFEKIKGSEETFEVTEKLDGSSMTVFNYNGEFGVCSRNLQLKIEGNENNAFVKTALELMLPARVPEGFALQGELIGEGIQGNPYKIEGLKFLVYNVYNIPEGVYIRPDTARVFTRMFGVEYVPVVYTSCSIGIECTMESLLSNSEQKSSFGEMEQEGYVFKSNERDFSFKAISNKWLLGGGE